MLIEKSTFDFLKSLKKNNNREWFEKNRDKYEGAKKNFEEFIAALLKEAGKLNKAVSVLEAKNCIFRIYRDVRFSKNKDPYKTNLAASINAGGRKVHSAGYYLHLEPGNKSFIGGGIWMPEAPALKKIRQEIDYNAAEFRKIMNDKKFKSFYGQMYPEYKLANPPKGYDKSHPEIELLKLTSFIVGIELKDTDVQDKNFLKKSVEAYKLIQPFINFFNTATE